ncbi:MULTISPECIES: HNH endonuclease family protein [Streptomyces violaceusniger group]|uniref:HNH endonuclease family protein n=1 Tax=Streptomyces antimycoticus TaxID=68175 RepID=A0ABD5JQ33_9ACTN|nr:HNH endonuclease family protein [Streptomyces sp. DSM 41602]
MWHSYYDDTDVPSARGLDIDHMVPLAEAWDSGASDWSAQERQDYANDLGDIRSLAAVTARENRSKADQDPREWLPTDPGARCRYLQEWVVVKARWQLAADPGEVAALADLASGCHDGRISTHRPADANTRCPGPVPEAPVARRSSRVTSAHGGEMQLDRIADSEGTWPGRGIGRSARRPTRTDRHESICSSGRVPACQGRTGRPNQ